MQFPIGKGDKGADVVAVQNCLNRLGALLVADGQFGPGSVDGLHYACGVLGQPQTDQVDEALWALLDVQPEPSDLLPTQGLTFIAMEEISSRKTYESQYNHPMWPGGESGMTIGIGYDLRHQTGNFADDWRERLSPADYQALVPWLGKQGSKDGEAALAATRQPFSAAWPVFAARSIPLYVQRTQAAFPGYDKLEPLCKSALVSLVYNRGTSLNGESRSEMKTIHDLIAAGDANSLNAVPAQYEAMKRLWPDAAGLRARRDREAALWREGMLAKA
jgi:hypothetical protein